MTLQDSHYIPRALDISSILQKKSCFLFGPRQTGKSSLIRHVFPKAPLYSLLEGPTYLSLSRSPERLRQELRKEDRIVIIDEIQKLPHLLDEVHALIEEHGIHFLLTGSSARKLRHGGVNLLGGRARSRTLHPFTFLELGKKFDLLRALDVGLIPSIYFSDSPHEDLESYATTYLKEEIAAEGLTRNIPAFSRFLEVAALGNRHLINYTEIGNDAQVPRTTVHEYFEILKDTLIASIVPPWKKTRKRKPTATDKLYFFDGGVVRFLQHRRGLQSGSPEFGDAFEAFLFHELKSYLDYTKGGELCYWQSTSGFEVDFIVSDEVAVEVKGKRSLQSSDLKGLRALQEEKKLRQYLLVSLEERRRTVEGIQILPWKLFLEMLWSGKLV